MSNLVIDLQEGFENERVEVRVDNRQVFAREGVTTDPRISSADGVRLHAEGPVEVRVNVLSRGLSRALRLDVCADVYVGVSIVGAELELRTADRPFFYM